MQCKGDSQENPEEARLAGKQAGGAYDVTEAVVVAINMHFARQAIVQLDRGVSEVRIRLHDTLLEEHVEQLRQVEPQLATSRHAEATAITENNVQWKSKYEEGIIWLNVGARCQTLSLACSPVVWLLSSCLPVCLPARLLGPSRLSDLVGPELGLLACCVAAPCLKNTLSSFVKLSHNLQLRDMQRPVQ